MNQDLTNNYKEMWGNVVSVILLKETLICEQVKSGIEAATKN